ncbi:MAG: hypothetical protein CVV05_00095 [Gammaproteobacteria bacterium HGW-Gammaproteobacteria-1]|jgi:hypothetical protein|nr:MAG: hypothetical protein CVV05_00095 [Gammaproteobacteria bacterium HGW-Gammaproteobacteria-1]
MTTFFVAIYDNNTDELVAKHQVVISEEVLRPLFGANSGAPMVDVYLIETKVQQDALSAWVQEWPSTETHSCYLEATQE